jgi:hypothetical protein
LRRLTSALPGLRVGLLILDLPNADFGYLA